MPLPTRPPKTIARSSLLPCVQPKTNPATEPKAAHHLSIEATNAHVLARATMKHLAKNPMWQMHHHAPMKIQKGPMAKPRTIGLSFRIAARERSSISGIETLKDLLFSFPKIPMTQYMRRQKHVTLNCIIAAE